MRPRHHQPRPRHRRRPAPAPTQPRTLEGRARPQHPRQRLRRGPLAHPNRPRARKHHPPAPLRHRRHPLPHRPLRRRHHATPSSQPQARLRLPAHDPQHPATIVNQPENKLPLRAKRSSRKTRANVMHLPTRAASVCRPAPVAQLDRALASEAQGHRFESCRARHRLDR